MAKIVETIKLQHQHPERLQVAMEAMKKHGYKSCNLMLLKELEDSYVYKILDAEREEDDVDEEEFYEDDEEENYDDDEEVKTFGCEAGEVIIADSNGTTRFTSVLSYEGNHYTAEEIRKWRYDFFEALLDISKKEHYLTKEECLAEIVGMTDYYIASIMPYNTPEGYADIVTM